MSNWFEDIAGAGTAATKEALSNVNGYIVGSILKAPSLVKIGSAPTGNLTPQELNAGMRPSADTYPDGNNNKNGRAVDGQSSMSSYLPWILGGAGVFLLVVLLIKKK